MTAIAMKKIVVVLIMKALLLGVPTEPGVEAPIGGYNMVEWQRVIDSVGDADGVVRDEWCVTADQMLMDSDAGLLVAVGPSQDTVYYLFGQDPEEVDVEKVLLRPDDQGHWQPTVIEFPWPREGKSYYLDEIEPNLFRRTELATKEGYTISASFSGREADGVSLELTRRAFTGGDYEDAVHAWMERPMAVRSVVSTTVPLSEERATLLVWRSPLQEQTTQGTDQARTASPAQPSAESPAPKLQRLALLPQTATGVIGTTGAAVSSAPPLLIAQRSSRSSRGSGRGRGSLDGRNERIRPKGLAVLLELKRWVFGPASEEIRKACEPLAEALSKATDGKARLDLEYAYTPPEGHLTTIPIVFESGEPGAVTAGEERYTPLVAVWLGGDGSVTAQAGHNRTILYAGLSGVSIVAKPASDGEAMALLTTDEASRLVVAKKGSGSSRGGGGASPVPPDGAPELPFAEPGGLAGPRGPGDAGAPRPRYRVWGPAGDGDRPRACVDIVVEKAAEVDH